LIRQFERDENIWFDDGFWVQWCVLSFRMSQSQIETRECLVFLTKSAVECNKWDKTRLLNVLSKISQESPMKVDDWGSCYAKSRSYREVPFLLWLPSCYRGRIEREQLRWHHYMQKKWKTYHISVKRSMSWGIYRWCQSITSIECDVMWCDDCKGTTLALLRLPGRVRISHVPTDPRTSAVPCTLPSGSGLHHRY